MNLYDFENGKNSRKKPSLTGAGISKKKETEFHAKLDTLVHNTFGKREEEFDEGTIYDLEKEYGYEKAPAKRYSNPQGAIPRDPADDSYSGSRAERALRADQERVKKAWADHLAKQKEQGVAEGSDERKQNALWAQITAHEKAAKASKDLKRQHHLKMADQLRSQLKTSDEQGVAEGYSLGKVLTLPELLDQIKHILTAKHPGIGWRMTMPAENTFLFSAQNDYDVWSMLVIEAGGDDWVAVGHGMVDPDGKPIIFDRQQLPMTLASASEIADEAIQTFHDIDLSDYADDEDYNQGVAEAKAATAAFRAGDKKRAKLNSMSDEERRAYDKEQQEKQRKRDDARLERERNKNKGVAEGEEMGTFAALKDWQVWNVHVYNNYYRGKYADYGPRPYSVVAGSPEEARQVIINNPDYVLQDLLSRKLQNGKKILPRGSALPVEEKRVGKAEPGSVTTMGLKKMLTPDGVQSFKFTNGKIVDGAHAAGGEEPALSELSNELLGDYKKELGVRASAADKAGDYDKGHEYFKKINKATIRQGENDARRAAEKEKEITESRLEMMRRAGYDL